VKVDGDGNAYVNWLDRIDPVRSGGEPDGFADAATATFPDDKPGVSEESRRQWFTGTHCYQGKRGSTEYLYSTFLGGSGDDTAWGIALGPDKSAYVTGYTDSGNPVSFRGDAPGAVITQNNFPTTASAFQAQNNGGYDAFLTRLAPDGSSLLYSTYIGGDANEGNANPQDPNSKCLRCADRIDGAAVGVDLFGNAYITGWTESTFVPSPPPPPDRRAPSGAT